MEFTMPNSPSIILLWTFSPPGYFEEPLECSTGDCVLSIADGKVEAVLEARFYNQDPALRERLHSEVISRFRAAQLVNQEPYKLSENPTIVRLEPDGRRSVSVEITGQAMINVGGTADIQVMDKNGNVVQDSRRERIEKRISLADRTARSGQDPLLSKLLESFHAAISDPGDELVHLYEIRDALKRKFGDDKAALSALAISSAKWSRLGRLADGEPLRQSRHRGLHTGPLRNATKSEIDEAREIARSMIEAYLDYLERSRRWGG
jgi:hypothetical protein